MFFVGQTMPRPVAQSNDPQTGVRKSGESENGLDQSWISIGEVRFVGEKDQHGEVQFTVNTVGDQFAEHRSEGSGTAEHDVLRLFQVTKQSAELSEVPRERRETQTRRESVGNCRIPLLSQRWERRRCLSCTDPRIRNTNRRPSTERSSRTPSRVH